MTEKTDKTRQQKSTFAEAIAEKILVFDGAMGTELYRHHVFTNRCFDELCLTDAKLIRKIHTGYRDAGADVLTTNTFGANRVELAKFGLAEQLEDIVRTGAAIARQVADEAERPVYVAGSIGPMPSQPQYDDVIEEMILQQVGALTEGGADFIMFETQPNRIALERCAAAMRKAAQVPYVLSFVVLEAAVSSGGEITHAETVFRGTAGTHVRAAAGGLPPAGGMGHELRHRTRRVAGSGRRSRAADESALDRAAQRRHAQGGRKSQDLFLLARISGHICQAIREPGCVGHRRLLRHHGRTHHGNRQNGEIAFASHKDTAHKPGRRRTGTQTAGPLGRSL